MSPAYQPKAFANRHFSDAPPMLRRATDTVGKPPANTVGKPPANINGKLPANINGKLPASIDGKAPASIYGKPLATLVSLTRSSHSDGSQSTSSVSSCS